MTTIQKVALLGVRPCPNQNLFLGLTTRQKGFLGSAVLDPLVKAGFDVTVLTRCRSSPPAIDASIQAGVKRFIPADFGALTTAPEAQGLPVRARPVEIQNYLKGKARLGEVE
ncbi:transcription factor NmrA [Aspergillus fumigatus]|nr:transcription factor NmrA [Aspergillus fumigatus]